MFVLRASILPCLTLVALGLAACDPGGGGRVAAAPCANGIQDVGETGVDCGGTCGACPGAPCAAPTECASRSCVAEVCAAPTCSDGIKNGTEVQIDCGGTCGACRPASCSNDVQDPNEAGVDCGGVCAPCEVTGGCDNDIQDPGEEGVDCGGPCTPCGQEPTCTDTFENGDETDVDCGGVTCPKCGEGKGCDGNGDCTTGLCDAGTCTAAAASCTNNEKDTGESDVDCGGTCPGCPTGKVCGDHGDCLSDTCIFGICRDPSCTDAIENQDETDVDCGGSRCPGCDDGEACDGAADCASDVCEDDVCVSCDDGAQNQDESDADCGGATCDKCPNEDRCGGPSDCVSNTCISGVCKPEGSSAGTCEVEGDCESGFFCEWLWNEESGASADWDKSCLVERSGAQPGETCEVYADCAGFGCFSGFCSQSCLADNECPGSGSVCASSEEVHDTDEDGLVDVLLPFDYCHAFDNGSGSCLSHADCPSGKRCTVYLDRNLTGGNLDPDGPYKAVGRCEDEVSGGGAEGAACEVDSECRSGYCGRQGICSRLCEASSECAPVNVSGVGTLNRLCIAYVAWGGGGVDDPSTFVFKSDCIAINSSLGPLAPCGPTAATPYTCGDGFGCQAVYIAQGPDVKAKAEFVCFATTDGFVPLGGDCDDDSWCESGNCRLDDNGENGYCMQPCGTTADCGATELTCQQEVVVERKGKYLNNGLSIGLCLK